MTLMRRMEGDVEFVTSAHLEGFEKHDEKFCFLLLSGNRNIPEKVSISKVCFENNYVGVLKEAKGNPKYDIYFHGKIKQRKGKFFFNVVGHIELVPTAEWTEEEIQAEINEFFDPNLWESKDESS